MPRQQDWLEWRIRSLPFEKQSISVYFGELESRMTIAKTFNASTFEKSARITQGGMLLGDSRGKVWRLRIVDQHQRDPCYRKTLFWSSQVVSTCSYLCNTRSDWRDSDGTCNPVNCPYLEGVRTNNLTNISPQVTVDLGSEVACLRANTRIVCVLPVVLLDKIAAQHDRS